ncbi:MAG: winged helix DNA-binding domain-containing protein [Propionibacteriales bacterium]|nr:winged helix DNA-binding domain-containing protein [Propionibacteriales bacterium]
MLSPRPQRLSQASARRIALAAQGFGRRRDDRPVGMRDVQRVINTVAQFQIDSINVVTRAQFMPLFSRLGPYDPALLERAAHRAPRRLFEFWGHAASLIDVRLQPELRWRMAAAESEAWAGIVRVRDEHPALVERVLAEVASRGPVTARQIEHDEQIVRDSWGWNWSAVKTALEWLLASGQITSASRNSQFERRYALPERVLPADVTARATPDRPDAMRDLIRRAAAALGVGSLVCLRDYFRTPVADTRVAVDELADSGELLPVTVDGWARPAWLWHEARRPRRIEATALVSPFDSLIFERARLQALFGVDYKIEIYVPEAKRRFGYYTYCLLADESITARVDLKADRAAGVLRVQSAWRDPGPDGVGADDLRTVTLLRRELMIMATWLGLAGVVATGRGDLGPALTSVLARD